MLLALILSLRVGANGQIALCFLAGLSIALRVFLRNHFEIAIGLIGLCVPLLPCMGSPVLLVFSLFLIALTAPRISLASWGLPFLCVCAAGSLVLCLRDIWAHDFSAATLAAGSDVSALWINLRENLRISPFPGMLAFEYTLRWLGLCLIAGVLLDRRPLLIGFLKMLALGFVFSSALGLADQAGLLPFALPSPGAFWRATGRTAFTLTDPNALGLLALIVVMSCALLHSSYRSYDASAGKTWLFVLALVAVSAGVYSASRTFFFGIFVWLALWLWLQNRRYFLIATICGTALILGLNAVLTYLSADQADSYLVTLPLGFQRLINSFSLRDIHQTFASRVVFNQAALNMWLDRPLVGVGAGQFVLAVVPYLPTEAGWSDNANNYFLGVLAETGIFGFAALVLPLTHLRISLRGFSVDAAAARLLFVFLLILILGPHLAFDEIALSIGAIASCIEPRKTLVSARRFFAFALGLIVLTQINTPYGVYPPEPDGSQWTSRHARFERMANASGEVTIAFQVLHPDASDYPLSVQVSSDQGEVRSITQEHAGTQTHQVKFSCASAVTWYVEQACKIRVKIDTSSTWIPALRGQGIDRRSLGVRIINVAR